MNDIHEIMSTYEFVIVYPGCLLKQNHFFLINTDMTKIDL